VFSVARFGRDFALFLSRLVTCAVEEKAMNSESLMTITEVSRECGVAPHVAKYAIAANGIEPRMRAGVIRLWSREDLPTIKAAINRTSLRREVAIHA
jgi:hypothetical protein